MSLFEGLHESITKLLKYEEVYDNKYGVNPDLLFAAKLNMGERQVRFLKKNDDNSPFLRKYTTLNRAGFRMIIEFGEYGLSPKLLKYYTPSRRENRLIYLVKYASGEMNNHLPAKPRKTINAAIPEEYADMLVELNRMCGYNKQHYMMFCACVFREAVVMAKMAEQNPAVFMRQQITPMHKQAPFLNMEWHLDVSKALGNDQDYALYLMNNTPGAFQSEIAFSLLKWWISLQLDGTLDLARQSNVLNFRRHPTMALLNLDRETLRRVLMEPKDKKPRTKSGLPSISEMRAELKTFDYSITKNKESRGYILSRGGFTLSGLTAREVFIAKTVIKQDRKVSYDASVYQAAASVPAKKAAKAVEADRGAAEAGANIQAGELAGAEA